MQILSDNLVSELQLSLNDCNADIRSYFDKRPYKVQNWLGGLHQQIYGGANCPYRSLGTMPQGLLCDLKNHIVSEFWKKQGIMPNVAYIQRTCEEIEVKPHRDPVTDLYFTTILYLGDFEGRVLSTKYKEIELCPGMLVKLPCTNGSQRGPMHWASSHKGTCYTMIFNCSVK